MREQKDRKQRDGQRITFSELLMALSYYGDAERKLTIVDGPLDGHKNPKLVD